MEEFQSIFKSDFTELIDPYDNATTISNFANNITKLPTFQIEYKIHKKNGSCAWVMETGHINLENDSTYTITSTVVDVTKIKQQEHNLRLSEERLRLATKASEACIFEINLQDNIDSYFENTEPIFGTDEKTISEYIDNFSNSNDINNIEAITKAFSHPDDLERVETALVSILNGSSTKFETRMRKYDNSYIWCKVIIELIKDENGQPSKLIGYIVNIDSIKKQVELFKIQSQKDALTGVYNKIFIENLVNSYLKENNNQLVSLFMIDIDEFKLINDKYGHIEGDNVIKNISETLVNFFSESSIIGRVGGDEFIVFMPKVPNENYVLKQAQDYMNLVINNYFSIDHTTSCSIGITIANSGEAKNFKTLYEKADTALYKAKSNGKARFELFKNK